MATNIEIIMTFILIMILEPFLLLFIYKISDSSSILLDTKSIDNIRGFDRIRLLYSKYVAFPIILFSSVAFLFWSLLYVILRDESFEIILLTSWLLPMFITWGVIDGYSNRREAERQNNLKVENLRSIVSYLHEQSILGSTEAKEKLKELSKRDDTIGLSTREILFNIDNT